jgi:D-threo-aldose 1-dehydrogenase
MRPAALAMGAAFLHESPEAVEAIRTALSLGINYFDTYPGHHEKKWGEALSGVPRSSYYLQAKIGTHPERRKDFSGEGARWSLDRSLRPLKTDYLDSVLVHDPTGVDELLREGAVFDVLREMKSQGVVRNIGLGARSHDWHVRLIDEGICDVSLTFLDYTLVNQSAAATIFPAARRQKTGIILASVQGMGLLTGEEPDPERERGMHSGAEPRAHRIWTWCRENGVNIRHLAIQFCLAAPVDSVVMFGPASIQHVHDAYQAATDTIPPELWEKLEQDCGIRPGMDAGQS